MCCQLTKTTYNINGQLFESSLGGYGRSFDPSPRKCFRFGFAMIRLDFIADPTLVACYAIKFHPQEANYLKSTLASPKAIEQFARNVWNRDMKACEFLRYGFSQIDIVQDDFIAVANNAREFLRTITQDVFFQPVLQETLKALSAVREEWEQNYSKTFDIMSELTGLTLEKAINVYITHPLIPNGENRHGKIFWTYRLDWPNYNTVYLWHEIMHMFLPPLNHNNDYGASPEHAVVELLTDCELRARVSGIDYPPMVGHQSLRELELKLLPAWKKYLEEPKKDISTFLKIARADSH